MIVGNFFQVHMIKIDMMVLVILEFTIKEGGGLKKKDHQPYEKGEKLIIIQESGSI